MTDEELIERIWTRAYLDTREKHIELLREFSSQEMIDFKTRLKSKLAASYAITDRIMVNDLFKLIDEK